MFVALLGADGLRGQDRGEAVDPVASCSAALAGLAPMTDGERLSQIELVTRVRRRSRDELCGWLESVVGSGAALAGSVILLADARIAQRRSWAEVARQACSRPAYGAEQEPAPAVPTFGIDGPRSVPLTLYD